MDEERSEAAWRALLTAALMGTERAPFRPLIAAGDLGAALAALDPSNPERTLLDSTALLAAYRRAGALPDHADAEPSPQAAPDERPPADARAANALEAVLRNPAPYALVREWCTLAAQAGVRIPDQFLPAILTRLSSDPAYLFRLPDGIGPRGRWLAAQNPAWRLLALEPGDEADAWATGDRATRLFALQMARRRDPDTGRAMLELTWKTEPAEDRSRFLDELAYGLSMADEPFLEAALSDRSAVVRAHAILLLSRIGGSRLVKRAIDVITPRMQYDAASGRIQVDLPEESDPVMQRESAVPRPRIQEMGEKTAWLAQLLGRIPPRIWTETFNATPQALIAAAERSIWKPPLLKGWTEAALHHADTDWLAQLPVACFKEAAYAMLAAEWLPAPAMEGLVTRMLQVDMPLHGGNALQALFLFKAPFFTRLQTRYALQRLRQTSEQERPAESAPLLTTGVRMLSCQVVAALHPSATGEVETILGIQDGDFSRWGGIMRDALQTLYQRREIHAAFGKL